MSVGRGAAVGVRQVRDGDADRVEGARRSRLPDLVVPRPYFVERCLHLKSVRPSGLRARAQHG